MEIRKCHKCVSLGKGGIRMKNLSFKARVCFCIILTVFFTLLTAIDLDQDPLSGMDFLVTRLITICLTVGLMHKFSFLTVTEFQWKGLANSLLWGIPLILLGIGSIILANRGKPLDLAELPSIRSVFVFSLNMLFVGITEELLYRGLIVNTLETSKNGSRAIIFSALIFGGAHFFNIFHMPLSNVLIQVLNAFSAGVLFCTIY